MKTLDEVIKSFELSCGKKNCSKCPYDDECLDHHVCECYERMNDTLHYLKAFRDAKDTLEAEKDRYSEAVRNCELAENKYIKSKITYDEKLSDYISLRDAWAMEQENPSLTWDELKKLGGKPVWVEADDGKYKRWFIVGNFFSWFEKEDFDAHVNLYCSNGAMEMSKEMYGFYWQAYRKERNENAG